MSGVVPTFTLVSGANTILSACRVADPSACSVVRALATITAPLWEHNGGNLNGTASNLTSPDEARPDTSRRASDVARSGMPYSLSAGFPSLVSCTPHRVDACQVGSQTDQNGDPYHSEYADLTLPTSNEEEITDPGRPVPTTIGSTEPGAISSEQASAALSAPSRNGRLAGVHVTVFQPICYG
ncbi:hypothetical protein BD626DRAFT_36183 [Schizophyllum amplum]|uniref:Uncharacterized protein n=1 Tax=Schizophyllum amplum TaxID=97359 RepID=A0A550CER7_9AGAR|nr:hypothetical protein BD626DRAFT_36183 [Auriculariopsis ampla]